MPSARPWRPLILVALAAPLGSSPAQANEGQWQPNQIHDIHDRAASAGLELSAEQLWSEGGGLLRASVNIGGCTAAFVSAEGLMSTNHHCAYGALQANSSVEHDYLKDGFLAPTRADELAVAGKTVRILDRVSDVTEQVQAKLAGIEDDRARALAFDQARNELIDACEAAELHRSCQLASFFGASRFELHSYLELLDVRLVYAPPSAIGEYGGETDNWMWPRHTGDFSLLRAYVGPDGQPAAYSPDNVPYQPAQWLVPSPDGVDEGDFVAILGYPGHTDRYMWGAELERHFNSWLPMRVALYGEWIAILEAGAARDPAVGIKVAALKKSLANRHKNAAGKIAGLERLNLVDTRRAEDQRLAAGADDARATIDELAAISSARAERDRWAFLLENLSAGPRSLVIARELAVWAQQRSKPDVERKSGYRDRDRDKLWNRLEQLAKDGDPQVDVELLASFLAHADALEGRRIAGFDALLGKARGAGLDNREPYQKAAEAALKGSALTDPSALQKLFDDPKAVGKSKDPMLKLARALVGDLEALALLADADRGRMLVLEPRYFELLAKLRGQPLYPDANATLRFSFATVQGYGKWDGSQQTPQTTLAGAVAKHTDSGEFDLPDEVLGKASAAPQCRWVDRELGDVPIAFLADGDTTGGNSGSPVIDGKGRLVGFNFDRVWENVSGDYAWRPDQSRNVISDARYLYWMLDEVVAGQHLLAELGVADYQPPPPSSEQAKTAEPEPSTPAARGCGCVVEPAGSLGGGGALLVLGLVLVRGRRRDE
ncbi:MAG TPA: S46 family peptidase [Enhygromyxa sp.]|nr:S46 family peptidase [Enhygromyxa sp.]